MSEAPRKRWGDRFDATLVRDLDPMHVFMPLMYLNRCDNEAFISEEIDLTNVNAYLERKNAENPEFRYTLFQVILTAMLKTITLRPKMNRFIAHQRMYQRDKVTASFTIKKVFEDESEEALAKIISEPEMTLDDVHEIMRQQIYAGRSEKRDQSSESMAVINKLPFFLIRFIVFICRFLDRRGKVPQFLIETDPFYSSVVLSNLGSIKLNCGYHHLVNWGTNSVFVVVGEKAMKPYFQADGSYELRETVELGMTIDERLADGFYYSKTIRLLKKLLENPELLDEPLGQKVEY